MERPKGEMPAELFQKIVQEYTDIGGGGLRLNPMGGDPLMDTKILERISLARQYDNINPIGMYTNGILVDKVGPNNLLESGIHKIQISIPGHNRECYKRLTGVDEFDRVSANVLKLLELNSRNGRKVDITIDVRSDVSMGNVVEEKAFQEFRRLTNQIDYQIFYHNWGGVVPSAEVPKTMKRERMCRRKGLCLVFYHSPRVLWTGDFSACGYVNINADQEFILGNAWDSHILEMWQSEAMKELRRRFAIGDLPQLCHRCSHYRSAPFGLDLRTRKRIKQAYRAFVSSDYFRRMRASSV